MKVRQNGRIVSVSVIIAVGGSTATKPNGMHSVTEIYVSGQNQRQVTAGHLHSHQCKFRENRGIKSVVKLHRKLQPPGFAPLPLVHDSGLVRADENKSRMNNSKSRKYDYEPVEVVIVTVYIFR